MANLGSQAFKRFVSYLIIHRSIHSGQSGNLTHKHPAQFVAVVLPTSKSHQLTPSQQIRLAVTVIKILISERENADVFMLRRECLFVCRYFFLAQMKHPGA